MDSIISLVVFIVLAFLVYQSSTRILKEGQRAVVFRLGKFMAVTGPGLILLMPFIDQARIINLDEQIPDWKSLPKEELEEKIKSVALSVIL